jgi:hypothetical protein
MVNYKSALPVSAVVTIKELKEISAQVTTSEIKVVVANNYLQIGELKFELLNDASIEMQFTGSVPKLREILALATDTKVRKAMLTVTIKGGVVMLL